MNKYMIHDLKRIINVEENWVDKSFVMTFFLNKTYVSFITIFLIYYYFIYWMLK